MKLGVCVPYRNREAHMHEFIPKVAKYLKGQGIDFHMYFCHQVDDKLFNRGATKNIAAKHAFEDGCDYIVWHDIDMIPEEGGGADYTFPLEGPRHIATQISQMDYTLKYHEYFGGAVLFSKAHIEKTNGYSNGYWDWGMEDDDLFWRANKENLTNNTYLYPERKALKYFSFTGDNSYMKIPYNQELRNLTARSHTVSVLVRAFQQENKLPIYLIGDSTRKYKEYPILRIPGYDYGFSFNNSRAISLQYWNSYNDHNYMWIKRYDNQWSWVTAVFDNEDKLSSLYLNGTEVDSKGGIGSPSPIRWAGRLKAYGKQDLYLGISPSEPDDSPVKYFRGDIAKVIAYRRALSPEEVSTLHTDLPNDHIVYIDPDNTPQEVGKTNIETLEELAVIPNSILPHRVEGKFRCLPHEDEGIIDNKFVKGETTAKNEERYVLQMQQGKIDYKQDGFAQVEYELVREHKITPFATMIDIKL